MAGLVADEWLVRNIAQEIPQTRGRRRAARATPAPVRWRAGTCLASALHVLPMERLARRLVVVTAVAAVALIAGSCAPLTAGREVSSWLLRGSIVRVSSSGIEVRHKSGRIISLALDSAATIEHDGEAVDPRALAAKQAVSIRVETVGQTWHARHVEIHSEVRSATEVR